MDSLRRGVLPSMIHLVEITSVLRTGAADCRMKSRNMTNHGVASRLAAVPLTIRLLGVAALGGLLFRQRVGGW